jgi:hypothetical protein
VSLAVCCPQLERSKSPAKRVVAMNAIKERLASVSAGTVLALEKAIREEAESRGVSVVRSSSSSLFVDLSMWSHPDVRIHFAVADTAENCQDLQGHLGIGRV